VEPVVNVKIIGFKFGVGPPHITWADITFANNNDYPVSDLTLRCDLQNAAGQKINDVTAHLYTIVPAKAEHTVREATLSVSQPEVKNAQCNLFAVNRHWQ
jgi:hypothetical protein